MLPFRYVRAHVQIEKAFGVACCFTTPYHSWERGTHENTNDLIRQYLPKGGSMKSVTQAKCNWIAWKLNMRPRECDAFKTPEAMYGRSSGVLRLLFEFRPLPIELD